MVVTIHQPEHLPWLGWLDKARQADLLVLLDDVPFSKHYYQNRNRIRAAHGACWLTVPVVTHGRFGQLIREVVINNRDVRWRARCWHSLSQYYRRAAFWTAHEPFFRELYTRPWTRLVELNEWGIRYLLDAYAIRTAVVRSSTLNVAGQKGERLLAICRRVRATVYLSGVSGRTYLDGESFAAAGIDVRFQAFHHPVYRQCYAPFLPGLSSLDLLLNHGPESLQVLCGLGVPTMEEVFQ